MDRLCAHLLFSDPGDCGCLSYLYIRFPPTSPVAYACDHVTHSGTLALQRYR